MVEEKNPPFDAEEWLNSKKKGISGKVPRADFIAKMKELSGEIEHQKKAKSQLETQLASRDQTIQQKDKEVEQWKETINKSNTLIADKEAEIKNLQSRPDITNQKYQELQSNISDLQSKCDELLNSQEKHRPEDLKPENLPADWEQQLEEKKVVEKNFADTEKKLSAIEEKLTETEKRPTTEKFQQAIQQEADKYKDYDSLKTELAAVKRKYDEEQKKPKQKGIAETEFEELKGQLQSEKEKNKVLEGKLSVSPPPIVQNEEIIKGVGKLLTDLINPLKQEITELKREGVNNQLNNSPPELPTDYQELKTEKAELLKILKQLGEKIEK